MFTPTAVAAALLFAVGPQQQQQPADDASPGHTVVGQDYTEPDGRRGRWASVEYDLPTGEQAELAITVIETGDSFTGEGWLAVEGEVVAEVTLAADGTTETTSHSRISGGLAETALGGLSPTIADDLFVTLLPEDHRFKCSAWGKKALKAGKYIWTGVVTGTIAVCCIDTAMAGCPICAAGAGIVGAMGADALANYCD